MTCSHCGQEIADGAKFCTHCGTITINANLPATWGKRLGNHIIDQVIMSILAGALFFSSNYAPDDRTAFIMFIIGIVVYFVYHLVLESCFGTTVGKLITGTKVVNKEGNKPRFLQVLGRTLARYIPLEPLSLAFGKYPVGWHDMLSGTYVVDKNMTPEQVKAIDPKVVAAHKNSSAVIIIIVVIIVIAIIGILSSVVLASLTTARSKGQVAAMQADLSSLRTGGEVYKTQNNSYTGFCQSASVKALDKYSTSAGKTYTCNETAEAWAVTMAVNNKFGCVDSSGASPKLIRARIGDATVCPVSGVLLRNDARDQSFTVEVPGNFILKTDKDMDAGVEPAATFTQDYYTLEVDEEFYGIIEHAYNRAFTKEEADGFIDRYLDGFEEETGTKIATITYGVEQGMSIAEFTVPITATNELLKGKLFQGKDRSYLVIMGDQAAGFNEDGYKRYVESFKLNLK